MYEFKLVRKCHPVPVYQYALSRIFVILVRIFPFQLKNHTITCRKIQYTHSHTHTHTNKKPEIKKLKLIITKRIIIVYENKIKINIK